MNKLWKMEKYILESRVGRAHGCCLIGDEGGNCTILNSKGQIVGILHEGKKWNIAQGTLCMHNIYESRWRSTILTFGMNAVMHLWRRHRSKYKHQGTLRMKNRVVCALYVEREKRMVTAGGRGGNALYLWDMGCVLGSSPTSPVYMPLELEDEDFVRYMVINTCNLLIIITFNGCLLLYDINTRGVVNILYDRYKEISVVIDTSPIDTSTSYSFLLFGNKKVISYKYESESFIPGPQGEFRNITSGIYFGENKVITVTKHRPKLVITEGAEEIKEEREYLLGGLNHSNMRLVQVTKSCFLLCGRGGNKLLYIKGGEVCIVDIYLNSINIYVTCAIALT